MRFEITFAPSPLLSVCRELQAHLEQVPDVRVTLQLQAPPAFDYLASPVGSLVLECPQEQDIVARVGQILDHYGQWRAVPSLGTSAPGTNN
jgi:hypothetical protein